MQVREIISKAEVFAMDFITKISSKTEQPERKQVYFLDTQDDLKKYMGALQKVVDSLHNPEDGKADEEALTLIAQASDIITRLRNAIAEFQKELAISDDITEEETTAVFTQETLTEAMENNATTKEIAANMNAIAEQQTANQVGYNYALVCDGQINMIAASTKSQLNDSINAIANTGTYKSIQLYKMQFTPVPLKQKTVLSV